LQAVPPPAKPHLPLPIEVIIEKPIIRVIHGLPIWIEAPEMSLKQVWRVVCGGPQVRCTVGPAG
jgi:hypothetical protein